jgi:aryl-alcohol dehydrogenase-like predicted oxidoreductase
MLFLLLWYQRRHERRARLQTDYIDLYWLHIWDGITQSSDMQANVARDKIVTNLDEFHSDIWMMQLGPGK